MWSVTASWWPGSCRSVTGGWLRSRSDPSKPWRRTPAGGSGLTKCESVQGGVSTGLPPEERLKSSVAASWLLALCQLPGTTPAGQLDTDPTTKTTLWRAHDDLQDCGGRHRRLGVVTARGRPGRQDCGRIQRKADHCDGLPTGERRFTRGRCPRQGGLQGLRKRARLRDVARRTRSRKGGGG